MVVEDPQREAQDSAAAPPPGAKGPDAAPQVAEPPAKPSSLDGFMKRAHDEGEYAVGRMTVPGIKKCRTSLRRARSVAEVFELFDPDPTWTTMRKTARALFREIGPLRDLHVMRTWIQALSDDDDEVGVAYQRLLQHNERKARVRVRAALAAFDWQQWQAWREQLGRRAAEVPRNDPVILQTALERWEQVEALHRQCQRDVPARVWHDLRKAVKRFRYTLEIFAPKRFKRLKPSVKAVQDALGELNDLDVLHDELMKIMPLFSTASRRHWTQLLRRERRARVDRYRALVDDEDAPPYSWLQVLPRGEEAYEAAVLRWERRYGTDTRRPVGEAARALLPTLHEPAGGYARAGRLLLAAAALVDLGPRPRASAKAIRALLPASPYVRSDLDEVALIVRYARRGLPAADTRRLAALNRPARDRVNKLTPLFGAMLRVSERAPLRLVALAEGAPLTDDERALLPPELLTDDEPEVSEASPPPVDDERSTQRAPEDASSGNESGPAH